MSKKIVFHVNRTFIFRVRRIQIFLLLQIEMLADGMHCVEFPAYSQKTKEIYLNVFSFISIICFTFIWCWNFMKIRGLKKKTLAEIKRDLLFRWVKNCRILFQRLNLKYRLFFKSCSLDQTRARREIIRFLQTLLGSLNCLIKLQTCLKCFSSKVYFLNKHKTGKEATKTFKNSCLL